MNDASDIRDPMRDLHELQAYLDGELSPEARSAVEARLEGDPALAARLDAVGDDFGVISALVTRELEQQAESVHQARFEQIWDAVERELDRDLAQSASSAPASAGEVGGWAKWSGWLRSARVPLGLTAAGAAAAVVALVMSGPAGTVATGPNAERAAEPAGDHAPATAPTAPTTDDAPATQIADAEAATAVEDGGREGSFPEPLPAPESNEADVERIEFGGASGRISKIEGVRGTTTVIWIEEDEEPIDNERSL